MIDYRTDAVALDQLRQSITATTFTDPSLTAKKSSTLTDIAKAGDYALLGSFIDHLIAHAASDGTEISLLQRAADLWQRGVDMCNTLGQVRKDLETALDNPTDPGAPALFNNAAMKAQQWAATLNNIEAEVVALQNDVDPMPHLPPHPRQTDKLTSDWDWLNLMLGRRTDAFVRNVAKAADDEATNAFAFGVLANYGANAAGSAYLGHSVGGARRAHRYRDRLARNAVGSWVAMHYPGIGSLTQMSQRLRFGHPVHPSLPPHIVKQLKKALAATFDEKQLSPLPDLQVGYRRLLQHLATLDQFSMPAPPLLPGGGWTQKLYGDPTNFQASLLPQDIGVSGDPGGGVSVGSSPNQPGTNQPGQDDSQKSSGGCGIGWLILAAILLVVAFIGCVVQWAQGKKCNYFSDLGDLITGAGRKDPPDPRDPPTQGNPQMTASGLTAFAPTEQATQMVAYFYELHARLWEALSKSYNYLAVTGLIYPDGLLDLPRFKQFVDLPAAANWPHRPEADPGLTYHLFPVSTLEHPLAQASPYAAASVPDVSSSSAVQLSTQLWRQIALAEQDSQNLDLDADRGFAHPCWAAKGSINNEPVVVSILAYKAQ